MAVLLHEDAPRWSYFLTITNILADLHSSYNFRLVRRGEVYRLHTLHQYCTPCEKSIAISLAILSMKSIAIVIATVCAISSRICLYCLEI